MSKWLIPKVIEDRLIEDATKPNDENGDPIYDLKFSIVMNDENDRAVKTWKAIDFGHQPTPVPLSRRVRIRLRWYRSRWPLVIEALKNEHECE